MPKTQLKNVYSKNNTLSSYKDDNTLTNVDNLTLNTTQDTLIDNDVNPYSIHINVINNDIKKLNHHRKRKVLKNTIEDFTAFQHLHSNSNKNYRSNE